MDMRSTCLLFSCSISSRLTSFSWFAEEKRSIGWFSLRRFSIRLAVRLDSEHAERNKRHERIFVGRPPKRCAIGDHQTQSGTRHQTRKHEIQSSMQPLPLHLWVSSSPRSKSFVVNFVSFSSSVIVTEKDKAEKVKQALPPGLAVKELKGKAKSS